MSLSDKYKFFYNKACNTLGNATYTFKNNTAYLINPHNFCIYVDTDATVASRYVYFQIKDRNDQVIFSAIADDTAFAANTTGYISVAKGNTPNQMGWSEAMGHLNLPIDFLLDRGDSIVFGLKAGVVGDYFTVNLRLEYLKPA